MTRREETLSALVVALQRNIDALWEDVKNSKLTTEQIKNKFEDRIVHLEKVVQENLQLPDVDIVIQCTEEGIIVHSKRVAVDFVIVNEGETFDPYNVHESEVFQDYEDLVEDLNVEV